MQCSQYNQHTIAKFAEILAYKTDKRRGPAESLTKSTKTKSIDVNLASAEEQMPSSSSWAVSTLNVYTQTETFSLQTNARNRKG